MNNLKNNFYQLDPNIILSCAEKHGFVTTGEMQQLNSYENRVFNVVLENGQHIIAKFYRPERWSQSTIEQEHQFEIELKNEGLSVAVPFVLSNGSTVDQVNGIYYTFFEKVRGRMMQEFLPQHFSKLGRWLAQLHNVGERSSADYRPYLGPINDNKWALLDTMYDTVSIEIRNDYFDAVTFLFEKLDDTLQDQHFIRIHGDLHRGNILETPGDDFVVVDFDDFVNGPSIQDMWMIFPETDFQNTKDFDLFLKGYEELRHFPDQELKLVSLMRAYRIISYAAWIHQRWTDPSFPKIFPQFGTYNYWLEELESLNKIIKAC